MSHVNLLYWLPSAVSSPFDSLPEELLVQILKYVRNASRASEFVSTLRVCQRWYRVGFPILCQNVVVTNSTAFGVAFGFPPTGYQYVRSFSVTVDAIPIPHARPLSTAMETQRAAMGLLWGDVHKLVPLLSNLTKMSTFSFKIQGYAPDFDVPIHLLTDLLKALPSGVVNLEVDTNALERYRDGPPGPSPHLCVVLRDLLPRLERVRLRLKFLCSNLLLYDGQAGKAASLAPRAEFKALRQLLIECNAYASFYGGLRHTTCACTTHHSVGPLLLETLRRLCRSAAFPSIENLTVVGFGPAPRLRDGAQYRTVNVCDILRGSTTSIPLSIIPSSVIQRLDDAVWMMRTPSKADFIGTLDNIRTYMHGDTAWVSTLSGSRFPLDRRFARNLLGEGHAFVQLSLIDSSEWKATRGASPIVWQKERTIGAKILSAEVHNDLSFKYRIQEVLPPNWTYRPASGRRGRRHWDVRRDPKWVMSVGAVLNG